MIVSLDRTSVIRLTQVLILKGKSRKVASFASNESFTLTHGNLPCRLVTHYGRSGISPAVIEIPGCWRLSFAVATYRYGDNVSRRIQGNISLSGDRDKFWAEWDDIAIMALMLA